MWHFLIAIALLFITCYLGYTMGKSFRKYQK